MTALLTVTVMSGFVAGSAPAKAQDWLGVANPALNQTWIQKADPALTRNWADVARGGKTNILQDYTDPSSNYAAPGGAAGGGTYAAPGNGPAMDGGSDDETVADVVEDLHDNAWNDDCE
jgi:hypothetical protein